MALKQGMQEGQGAVRKAESERYGKEYKSKKKDPKMCPACRSMNNPKNKNCKVCGHSL